MKEKSKKIEKLITKNTKAIVVVHLHGLMCDMDEIRKIARKYRLKIIEDSAQAHGSKFKKRDPSHYSDAATFSFYPTKNLGAIGEGGAVLTNNKKVYEKFNIKINYIAIVFGLFIFGTVFALLYF